MPTYERVMQGFNEEFRQLKNSVTAMLGASGALLPIFTDIMRQVRFGVEAVSAWTAANSELTATIVKGTAALLAFGIATRVVGFGFALMQGGILRTAALFLSLMGRSLRFAGRSGGFLYRRLRDVARLASMPFRWARFMPRFAWRSVITPTSLGGVPAQVRMAWVDLAAPSGGSFAQAILETIPKHWRYFRDQITDNFRIISNENLRVLG